jgi:K+-transporting ATPase KdpF subunit
MSAAYVIGALIAAALIVYLLAAMLKPEWFE